jgi:serine phosphatase RsbU (regulator of sigma subunit)
MINLVALPLGGILLILCPITINLALEERIKAFKDDTFNKLQVLNLELDTRVKDRTIELEKANNMITDSIQSASAIQSAILPRIDPGNYGFSELVYILEPRDIVGGDFYWVQQQKDWTALVVADCTGHGIPGVFMTLISSTILDRVASLHDLSQPDVILDQLDELLGKTFKLNSGDSTSFGLDCGVCCFFKEKGILRFAGAKSNLYHKLGEEVIEMKGDKISLGYAPKEHPIPFQLVEIKIEEASSFYMFSDGITDQVGGEKNLMYGKRRLLHHIKSAASVANAVEEIMADLSSYQSAQKRRDDLTLFGFSF